MARNETINLALGGCSLDVDCYYVFDKINVEYREKWKRTVTSSKCSNVRQRLGNYFDSDFECVT